MHIYFVRHGETAYNKSGRHQSPDIHLSDKGRKQIQLAANKLKGIPVTKIISSDFTRTLESADIIGKTLSLAPEPSIFFREVRRASSLYGKKHFSVSTFLVGLGILINIKNKNWHHSDEESVFDVKERVKNAVDYLAELEKEHEHVVVVSHAFIINIFIKFMCFYKDIHTLDYLRTLVSAKMLGNASISKVSFANDDNPNTCDWILESRNDKSHLST